LLELFFRGTGARERQQTTFFYNLKASVYRGYSLYYENKYTFFNSAFGYMKIKRLS